MSYYRNVQNSGAWQAGETYTFEVWQCSQIIGECGPNCLIVRQGIQQKSTSPLAYLFDNNTANLLGGITGTNRDWIADLETEVKDEVEGLWTKYSITVPVDLSDGTYYLKYRIYDENQEFG